ncbi:MAG: DUF1512 domain-containing protein [Thaumarchaeota archaeon]|nr:MAG: DUF1512 domain-containing protein [Nitrososphaerota archaeon]
MSLIPFALVSGVDLNSLFSLATYALFFVFILYGQRIQYYVTLGSISRSLNRLKVMEDGAKKEALDYITQGRGDKEEITERVNGVLEYVTILPESVDPSGVISKIEHVVRTGDDRIRGEVRSLLGSADRVKVSVAQNMLEVASALNTLHKVVRHYYLTGKKTSSYMTLVQLQMMMPQIMEQAQALAKAATAIRGAQPIGDGLGPTVASRFLGGAPAQSFGRDTVMAVTQYEGRLLYVVKAEGPMGYVGEPGVALRRLIEEMGVKPAGIIMVDAALKLEGEKTGEIAEGVGAAIGGIGVEKFQIEEVAANHKIPIYAILVKESDVEAITTMKKEIGDAVPLVMERMKRLIGERTSEGDSVVLIGVGNTLGVGQ